MYIMLQIKLIKITILEDPDKSNTGYNNRLSYSMFFCAYLLSCL